MAFSGVFFAARHFQNRILSFSVSLYYNILYYPLYYDPQKDQKIVFFHHQMAGTWNIIHFRANPEMTVWKHCLGSFHWQASWASGHDESTPTSDSIFWECPPQFGTT